jgi:hypothetical protein
VLVLAFASSVNSGLQEIEEDVMVSSGASLKLNVNHRVSAGSLYHRTESISYHEAVGTEMLADASSNVLPDDHDSEAESGSDEMKVPAVAAVQYDTSVNVSVVPPLVNVGVVVAAIVLTLLAFAAAPKLIASRVDWPTEMLAVPALPGSPVWI